MHNSKSNIPCEYLEMQWVYPLRLQCCCVVKISTHHYHQYHCKPQHICQRPDNLSTTHTPYDITGKMCRGEGDWIRWQYVIGLRMGGDIVLPVHSIPQLFRWNNVIHSIVCECWFTQLAQWTHTTHNGMTGLSPRNIDLHIHNALMLRLSLPWILSRVLHSSSDASLHWEGVTMLYTSIMRAWLGRLGDIGIRTKS